MEHASHPCHQCNAEVEEGFPFCRKCGAPQIRVSGGQEAEQQREGSAATGGSEQPALGVIREAGVDRSVARRQAAPAAILIAVLAVVSYFFAPAFLLMPLAGILAVQLYLRRRPGHLSVGAGAGIGLLAGFFGFLIADIPYLAVIAWCLVFHPDWAPVQNLRAQIETAIRIHPGPSGQQLGQSWLTPSGLLLVAVLLSVVSLVVTLIFSGIGGAIGAALLKRRH